MRICYVLIRQDPTEECEIECVYRHEYQAYKIRMSLQEKSNKENLGLRYFIDEVELK